MKNLSITNSEKKQNKTNKNSERAGLVSNAKFEVNVISRPVRDLKPTTLLRPGRGPAHTS